VDLSSSYDHAVPVAVLARYDWCETRNAASILRHTNPAEFTDMVAVIGDFRLEVARDIAPPGRNESLTAAYLNRAFRMRGWRAADYNVASPPSCAFCPSGPQATPRR